eukprot:scaffold36256_cov30-Prasinocladus_malaysianus.AAC.1
MAFVAGYFPARHTTSSQRASDFMSRRVLAHPSQHMPLKLKAMQNDDRSMRQTMSAATAFSRLRCIASHNSSSTALTPLKARTADIWL